MSREEDDTFWHSSLVTERLESHLVRTVSGKVYQLMGDMDLEEALFGGLFKKLRSTDVNIRVIFHVKYDI